jgi:hypothetical protein
MSKLKAQNSHLAILWTLLEINKNLSSEKCEIFFFSVGYFLEKKFLGLFLYFWQTLKLTWSTAFFHAF